MSLLTRMQKSRIVCRKTVKVVMNCQTTVNLAILAFIPKMEIVSNVMMLAKLVLVAD